MPLKTCLDGDKILREYTYTGSLFSSFSASAADCITYYYDESGDVIGLNYYGTDYYYYKNIFGDVLGIMPPSGTMVVRYSYDAWGNILSITGTLANSLGKDNPFRYRSYYYDNETGWYYLQSRYYDPSICRFISPDDRMLTGEGADELNLYAYCKNNPVNLSDPDGHWGESILWAIAEAAGTATPAGLIALAGITIAAALIYEPEQMTIAVPLPIPRAKEKIKELAPKIVIPKTKAIEKTDSKLSPFTPIYRYGGTNPSNLTPKEKDFRTGLSFLTEPPPPGVPATVTTMEAINATGMLIAINDHPGHVSVIPAPQMGTLQDWIGTGSSHPCTSVVKSVVVKWFGGL